VSGALTRILIAFRARVHPLHRLRRIAAIRALLAALDVPLSRRLAGLAWPIRLRLVRHLSLLVDSRIAEPGVHALFVTLARSAAPVVFWDVGANIGFYSLLILSTDETATAVLFEPDPDNCALIRRTLSDGRIAQARLIEAAAGATDGTAAFFADRVSGLTGSLQPEAEAFVRRNYAAAPRRLDVLTVRLDSLLAGADPLPPPTVIKIDVEGAEDDVIEGAAEILSRHAPLIVFESFAGPEGTTVRALEARGYRVVSAEGPDAARDAGSNYLAVPPAWQPRLDALRAAWRGALSRLG
jgi:FkbM family methyltransferase